MFFESSLRELTKFIANGIPKLSTEPSKRTLVLIQSRWVLCKEHQQLHFDMGIDLHTFQQHTEVRWLSISPAISRVIEQWDAICQFIKGLGKNEKTAPKSGNYKRVAAMLTGEEKYVKFCLNF